MTRRGRQDGYAMAALLVGMSVMAIVLSMAMPVWRTFAQREREAELVFRGEQYARAVELYQRKYAGAFPPSLDVLLNERMLRRRYRDPMSEDGEFQLLFVGQDAGQAGQIGRGAQPAARQGGAGPRGGGIPGVGVRGGIMGVTSKSTAASLREYNGRGRYNEWAFVATPANVQAGTGGPPGQQGPQRGRGPNLPGRQGQPPGRQGQPPGFGPRGGFPPPGGGAPPARGTAPSGAAPPGAPRL
ncbi:MAG: type II secretion system protein [Acidimicrobiia bacterium]|nr:type II secretion system protein [Acidimicrobiia bacterium]